MDTNIRWRFDYDKAIEIIVWLANRRPGIDIYHVAKVVYFAEKLHLNRYARPIVGDTYINMDYGQVPSGIRDLITDNPLLSPDHLQKVADSFVVQKSPHPSLKSLREPNMDYFSGTDIQCLEESLREYGEKSFSELKRIAHDEKSYLRTGLNQPIDYTLLIDDDNPNREEILEEMSQTSVYVQF